MRLLKFGHTKELNKLIKIWPIRLSVQWVPGTLSPGAKRLVREADHSPPPSDEVKNVQSFTSTPPYVFMRWYLVKTRDNF